MGMRVISVYFHLNVCKLYDGPIRLLADHDFTVRCIHDQVESIARAHWMVPLTLSLHPGGVVQLRGQINLRRFPLIKCDLCMYAHTYICRVHSSMDMHSLITRKKGIPLHILYTYKAVALVYPSSYLLDPCLNG